MLRQALSGATASTTILVYASPDLPSPRTYSLHFSPLTRRLARLGYYPAAKERRGGRGALGGVDKVDSQIG